MENIGTISGTKSSNLTGIKKIDKNIFFYLYLFLMLVALFLRNALELNIPVIFLLLLTVILAVSGTESQILAMAVCCIPLSAGFQYKYALLICIVCYIIKKRGEIRLNRVFLLVMLMMIWELFHMGYGEFSFYEYFRSFAELWFLIIVTNFDMKEVNYKLVLRAYSVATVGICLILLYIQLKQNDFNLISLISKDPRSFRFGQNNTDTGNFALVFNPNRLGFICNLSTSGMLFLLNRNEHSRKDLLLLMLSVIFCLLTLSRTATICLAFMMVCYVVMSPSSIKRKLGNILKIVFVFVIIVVLIYLFMPKVFDNILSRFMEEDITNGRFYLFSFYNQHIFSSALYLLFGIGLQDFQGKLSDIYGYNVQVSHNGFQEIIIVWGIVGLILFGLLLAALIVDSKRYAGKRKLISFIPLFMWLIYVSAGQLIRSEVSLLSLSMVLIYLSISFNESTNDYNSLEAS